MFRNPFDVFFCKERPCGFTAVGTAETVYLTENFFMGVQSDVVQVLRRFLFLGCLRIFCVLFVWLVLVFYKNLNPISAHYFRKNIQKNLRENFP